MQRYRIVPVGGTQSPAACAIEDARTQQLVASSDVVHLPELEELVRCANLGYATTHPKENADADPSAS